MRSNRLNIDLIVVFFGFLLNYVISANNKEKDVGGILPDEDQLEGNQRAKEEFARLQNNVKLQVACEEVQTENVVFYLYTREFSKAYLLKVGDQKALQQSTFNINKPMKVIVHGYLQDGLNFAEKIKTAYLQKEDVNVIGVDWGKYSNCPPLYVYNKVLPAVAKILAQMLKMLYGYGANPLKTELVGHSFGADIVGLANQKLPGQQAPRIIGLDPAGVLTYFTYPTGRLYIGDAKFVLILHTNMGLDGMAGQIGHADFYPNGGTYQPGCALPDLFCSHERSVAYFTESILSQTGFYGLKCINYKAYLAGLCNSNNEVIFGEDTPDTTRGKYYFKTNKDSPYARGKRKAT